jgi:hypothetical protein
MWLGTVSTFYYFYSLLGINKTKHISPRGKIRRRMNITENSTTQWWVTTGPPKLSLSRWNLRTHLTFVLQIRVTYNCLLVRWNSHAQWNLQVIWASCEGHRQTSYAGNFTVGGVRKSAKRRHPLTLSVSNKGEVKGNVVPTHAMKACRENRSMTPFIPNFDTRQRWADNYTTRPLHPR